MSLHSNSLFHFTNKDGLLYILKNNFVPCYCKERLSIGKKFYDYRVPIVSFCDIPLSQTKSHIEEYGKYAIGLNREWVEEKGLNPVFYYKDGSFFFKKYFELINSLSDRTAGGKTSHEEELSNYYFAFFKPYKGVDIRPEKGKKKENAENTEEKTKVFYDEREWRYVPEGLDEDNYIVLEEDYNDKLQEQINKFKLTFKPDDISFIIIEKEKERQEFIHNIWEIKEKYSPETKKILMSKIISSEQILNDM
jgi:hypothetical protein